jgi:hypothetical protein
MYPHVDVHVYCDNGVLCMSRGRRTSTTTEQRMRVVGLLPAAVGYTADDNVSLPSTSTL